MTKRTKEILKEIAGYGAVLAVSAFVFCFVLKVANVSGNSMNDTYQDGDTVICLRTHNPQKGDVIVCDTDAEKTLIKRVIATAGDVLDIDFETGTITLNGEILEEPYIKEPTYLDEGGFEYPITVPEGCYFVMGDNRNASSDSRDARIGYIKPEQIYGKVLFELPF